MALTFDTLEPVNTGLTMLHAAVTGTDRLLIQRNQNYIGKGKWQFSHTPATSSPVFVLEATFSSLVNAAPGWHGITTTGHEIPEMASAIRIRGSAGGQFSMSCEGPIFAHSTLVTDTFTVPGSFSLSATEPSRRVVARIAQAAEMRNYVVTVASSDTTKATVSNIVREEDLVVYTVNRVATGFANITVTLKPLHSIGLTAENALTAQSTTVQVT